MSIDRISGNISALAHAVKTAPTPAEAQVIALAALGLLESFLIDVRRIADAPPEKHIFEAHK